jgi:hypothetical protein
MRSVRTWGEAATELLEAPETEPTVTVVRQRVWRSDSADVFGVARCPRCHVELVARMGRAGPCFPCECPGK